jgi:hypothetical protein
MRIGESYTTAPHAIEIKVRRVNAEVLNMALNRLVPKKYK